MLRFLQIVLSLIICNLVVSNTLFADVMEPIEIKENLEIKDIRSFADCVAAGNTLVRSFPVKCITPDGKTYVQDLNQLKEEPMGTKPVCENLCGNGTCEEIVCQAVGCPCAETKESCPKDCAAPANDNAETKTSK